MPPRLLAVLVAACALILPHSARASVPAAELDALVDRNLDALYVHHLPWGGFHDPLTGPQFNYGAVALAWLAGERLPHRHAAATATLRYSLAVKSPGAFQTWLQAEAVNGTWLDAETRAALADQLRTYAAPAVGPRAQFCQRRPDCYNNLKLVDAVASLALVRTGLRVCHPRHTAGRPGGHRARGARVPRPARARRAAPQPADHRRRRGRRAVGSLAEPARLPRAVDGDAHAGRASDRAQHAMLPAARCGRWWASRIRAAPWPGWVAGRRTPGRTRQASTRRLAGAAEFAAELDLAPRLRRLAQLSFAELQAREGSAGFAVLPGPPRATLAGADKSQNTIVCNGLTLAFLHLAAREAVPGPTTPLPAELPGSAVVDPTAAGVAAVRGPNTWFAVHRAATHRRDARYDVGLLAAHVLVDGTWRSVVGQRPEYRQRDAPADRGTSADAPRTDADAVGPVVGARWHDRAVRCLARWRSSRTRDVALHGDRATA